MIARAGAYASQKGDPDRLGMPFLIDLTQLPGQAEIGRVRQPKDYGCSSMLTLTALASPVAASPTRWVGTPGSEAGTKITVPSMAEVAVESWDARSSEESHRPCVGQGGAQAYNAW